MTREGARESHVGRLLFNRYRLDRLLGYGGSDNTTYAATDLQTQGKVAVKFLAAEVERRDEFLREVRGATNVGHAGALQVLDIGVTDEGAGFLVTELLEGETLDVRLRRAGGKLPTSDVLRWMDELLEALESAHAAGILHRDINPANLFVTSAGSLKILGFGVSKGRSQKWKWTTPLLTDPDRFRAGTSEYTPAENTVEQVTALSDLWQVGATAYFLLSGRRPSEASNVQDVYLGRRRPPPPLSSVAPDVSPSIAQVIDRALAFEPHHPWASAREMRLALAAAATAKPNLLQRLRAGARITREWDLCLAQLTAAAACAGLATVLAAMGIWFPAAMLLAVSAGFYAICVQSAAMAASPEVRIAAKSWLVPHRLVSSLRRLKAEAAAKPPD